jgi:hypothetical protein
MPCHYVVEVDRKRSANKKAGYLDYFAAGEKVRVMRARAEAVYPGTVSVYRRTFAMIDDGDDSFLIDLVDVEGGSLHDYHFHGLPFGAFTTTGLELVSTQEQGTLLGEEVAWGADDSEDKSGYDFLRNVRRYKPSGVWTARWAGRDDCRLAYWMPAYPEVIVCDGEPPAKPDYPDTMEFVVARNPAQGTRFPAVIAPSRGSEVVKDVSFAQDPGATVYQVGTADCEWTIRIGNGGAFSATCVRADEEVYAFHANKTEFAYAGAPFSLDDKRTYTIESVHYGANVLTLDEAVESPELLVGQVAIVRHPEAPGHSAAYTIAEAGEHTVRFEGPARTGLIIIDTSSGETVTTKTRLSGYGLQIASRSFIGMALVDEDLSNAFRIASYSSPEGVATFTLATPGTFPDTDNDARRLAYLADFAAGYVVEVAPWAEVMQADHGALQVNTNAAISKR